MQVWLPAAVTCRGDLELCWWFRFVSLVQLGTRFSQSTSCEVGWYKLVQFVDNGFPESTSSPCGWTSIVALHPGCPSQAKTMQCVSLGDFEHRQDRKARSSFTCLGDPQPPFPRHNSCGDLCQPSDRVSYAWYSEGMGRELL